MPPPLTHTGGGGGGLSLAPLVGADKENQLPAPSTSGASSLLHKPLLLHKSGTPNATGTPLRAMMGLSKLGGGALRRPAAAAAVPEEDDDDDELTAAVQAATAAATPAAPTLTAPAATPTLPSTPAKSHGSMLKLGGSHAHAGLSGHGTPKLSSTKPLHIGSSAMPVRAASAINLPTSSTRAHPHTLVPTIPSVAAVAAAAAVATPPAAPAEAPSQPSATAAPAPIATALPVAPVAVVAPAPVVAAAPIAVAVPVPVAAPAPVAIVAPTPAPTPVVAAVPTPVAAPIVTLAVAAPIALKPAASAPAPAPAAISAPAAAVPPRSATSSSSILQTFTEVRTKHGFLLNGTEYSKLRTIGKGGSSLVYLVCSPSGQLFALKEMILPACDASAAEPAHVADYVTEVSNMLAMKGSPHVAQLHLALEQMSPPSKPAEFDDESAPPRSHATRVYMLMEAGVCDLDTHLTQVRSELSMTPFSALLPSYMVRWLWAQMLRCIAAVHAKGIIHTDLKPVNFILGGEKSTLKLIDFGIAKHFDVDAGATSALNDKPVGTLNYMSPESLSENVRLRSSTDVWSAGCILYAWVYGEAPFARFQKLPAKMHAIANAREHIAFPSRIKLREEVLTPEQEKDKSFLKGTGLVVTIEAARPASKDGSQPAREASCCITKTYRRMPPHLQGLPLPHCSERVVGEDVRQVLRACLQRKPEERPTAIQLLAHPYTAGGDEVSAAVASNPADAASLAALQTDLAAARAAQSSEAAARAALQAELASARASQAAEAATRTALQAELESLRAAQEASARQAAESAARAAAESAARSDLESRSRCVSLKSRLAFQAALLQLVDKVCRKSLEKAASARVNYARPRRDVE